MTASSRSDLQRDVVGVVLLIFEVSIVVVIPPRGGQLVAMQL